MEDRQKICDLFCATLQATSNGRRIESIQFMSPGRKYSESAIIKIGNREIEANVSWDSGTAMISDIMRALSDEFA